MKRFKLRQEFALCKEDGTTEKECGVQVYVTEEGIEHRQILNLFNTIACGYIRFLGEECGAYDTEPGHWPDLSNLDFSDIPFEDEVSEEDKQSDGRKRWFK